MQLPAYVNLTDVAVIFEAGASPEDDFQVVFNHKGFPRYSMKFPADAIKTYGFENVFIPAAVELFRHHLQLMLGVQVPLPPEAFDEPTSADNDEVKC